MTEEQSPAISETHTLGKELKVGDLAYGARITELRFYQVPARILISSVAKENPDGLPAWLAEIGPSRTKGPFGITIFHNDYIPKDGVK